MLAAGELWRVDVSDNLPWLQGLPTGYASMALTSGPYEDARTYAIGFKLKGQAWVDWMVPRVVELCRVTAGLVLVNMSGKVEDATYHPVVEWLVADLTRHHGIVCGPAPYCFFRFGIPGSGSVRYHRRDWEPVYAFARPECLPLAWSDNTAMGHAPKWAPGGEMSHRLSDGTRKNQWGGNGTNTGRGQDGVLKVQNRPSHFFRNKNEFGVRIDAPIGSRVTGSKKDPEREKYRAKRRAPSGYKDGDMVERDEYTPPVLANPGNVIREQYDAEEVRQLLMGGHTASSVEQGSPNGDVIRCLVGGNQMGSKAAHKSEAPFPEILCEYLIRSYCAEGGIVLDPHAGSGTALAVAVRWGRRALGCELRESQAANARERVRGEVGLFDRAGA